MRCIKCGRRMTITQSARRRNCIRVEYYCRPCKWLDYDYINIATGLFAGKSTMVNRCTFKAEETEQED